MQLTLFDLNTKTLHDISNPDTYKGISSFHKYWGKKPSESLFYFIQEYTSENDIVLDPFLGSGMISVVTLLQKRRFIGIDINPFSIEHTAFLLTLPNPQEYINAINKIKQKVQIKINKTYLMKNGKIASHYLWNKRELIQVWQKPEIGRSRIEFKPEEFDLELFSSFSNYAVKNIRKAHFFANSRINSKPDMSIYDIFTRRALRNIDLIIDEIKKYPTNIQRALFLTLTASSGQMSSMVFAITGRGKTKNIKSEKVEVGSWIIGFWRPDLHFEINVWNCFESKAKKLYKSLIESDKINYEYSINVESVLFHNSKIALVHGDSIKELKKIPDNSIKLIITDPPHSDRIPYLELSEIWNSILNKEVNFNDEIIVSNARDRNKNKDIYYQNMVTIISEVNRVLREDGFFLLYFNARDKQSWSFMESIEINTDLSFVGAFPMEYSASSVVQENRKGGMKTDYILVMKHKKALQNFDDLKNMPGWITEIPKVETILRVKVENE